MKSWVRRASEPGRDKPVLPSGGTPLDTGVRRVMEGRFRYDFSAVRVHTDSAANESAAAIGARAYTSGRDIVFGAGCYDPQSAAGRRLLAHELAHIVQQSGHPGTPQGQADAEAEAHDVAAGGAGSVIGRVGSGLVQADDDPAELRRQLAVLERQAATPANLSPDELASLTASRNELQARLAAAVRAAAHTSGTEPPVSRLAGQQPVGESPTPESMVRLVVEQRHFAASGPSAEGGVQPIPGTAVEEGVRGKAAGPGYQTNAAIQVIDAQSRQVAFELAQYAGGSQPHAEAQGVARLRFRLTGQNLEGGKLVVAVDQVACEGCLARLRNLATDLRLSSYEVWAPTAQEGRTAGPKWTARTAATASARLAPAPVSETPGSAAYRYEPRMIQGEMLAPPPSAPPASSSPAPPATPATKTAGPAAKPPAAESETARARRPATPEPAPARRPTAEPEPTRPTRSARPAAPEPASAKRLGSTPPESAGIPRGRPGSVELIGHAHAGATGALMSQAMTRLNEVAREHPDDKDLAWTVNTVTTVLDVESFIKDPKDFVAGEIKAGIFNAIFSHYSEKLATIRQSFEDRFPSLAQIQKDPIGTGMGLESYRKDYEVARARLRGPGASRALLYVSVVLSASKDDPPEVIQQRLHEVDEAVGKAYDTQDYFEKYKWHYTRYQFAMYLLSGRLEQLSVEYADLPAGMADDLRTRGRAVHQAADVFRDTRNTLWDRRLVVFAPVLAFALDLETAADGLDAIAHQFESFAAAVGSRRADYDREVQRLRAETTRIAERPLFGR
ncbi:hypothetical protein TUSST3_81040 [Streptomyces sp. TUS-ST3]|uniref:eCIS core domain-containing protein n=1 Tax=Streptomyces sp. TUS-ST3 TaxID=3025591 RepID=UPI00235B57C7|nr:DUF4157 domain-containing protein [Streptomyces sp. TUS-ST3]GLP71484.1 hypothetical protein TUSST3_81040 [Streptomyces sp. TUS-ST3]